MLRYASNDLERQPSARDLNPLESNRGKKSRNTFKQQQSPYKQGIKEKGGEGYVELGGLGPANVGSEAWMAQKRKREQARAYADMVVSR